MKICHMTSAHPRYDTRIFIKECCSLSKKFDTYLVVADGKGNESLNNVHIIDAGKFNGRKNRMLRATSAVYAKALQVDAKVYHLHDPELIPIGIKLKLKGKKVIFDAHEDLPNQIKNKHYLNGLMRYSLSNFAKQFEKFFCSKFDGIIVAAEPVIKNKFLKINANTVVVNNYPKLEELGEKEQNIQRTENEVCYVGGLTSIRGIVEIVEAISFTQNRIRLVLAGNFTEKHIQDQVEKLRGWEYTDFLGYVDRTTIKKVLGSASIGLVTLHPTPSYLNSMPVKMFEYMCAGIPVIASDFPLWKPIIEEHYCGICVDPLKAEEIARAIDFLVDNPEIAKQMGNNGKKLVEEKYSWEAEENILLKFYDDILGLNK